MLYNGNDGCNDIIHNNINHNYTIYMSADNDVHNHIVIYTDINNIHGPGWIALECRIRSIAAVASARILTTARFR